eukprot:6194563-Pleurochrysis_carterae.AAC.3
MSGCKPCKPTRGTDSLCENVKACARSPVCVSKLARRCSPTSGSMVVREDAKARGCKLARASNLANTNQPVHILRSTYGCMPTGEGASASACESKCGCQPMCAWASTRTYKTVNVCELEYALESVRIPIRLSNLVRVGYPTRMYKPKRKRESARAHMPAGECEPAFACESRSGCRRTWECEHV